MRVVLSDTSPVHYLILIGEEDVLAKLYGRVLIPASVARELNQSHTPLIIRNWICQPPEWIEIVTTNQRLGAPVLANLDEGERDAILLALDLDADLVLMDDREGVEQATRLGLTVTGTLGILDRAAEKGLLHLPNAVARLRTTNFRASPTLFDRLLAEDANRRPKA